jgi:uncharacterized protein YyaL (SSP411 family)
MTLSECKDKDAWMNKAKVLLEIMIRDFYDDKKHIFYMTSKQEKNLLVKPTDVFDGATPSSTAMATVSLLRFNKKSKNENFAQVAKNIFKNYSNSIKTMPQGFGTLLGHAKGLLPN